MHDTPPATPLIVVLDGYTNNPGDLSWQRFAALGELTVHDRSAPAAVVPRCAGAAVICTNKTPLTAAHMAALPGLRYIGVLATGVNVVDLAAARARGIVVTNVPAYGTDSVAQHTIGLMLCCASRIAELDRSVRTGEWQRRQVFSYWDEPPMELAGKVLGLIGLGAIGRRVAAIAGTLGMEVIAYTPSGRAAAGVEAVDLDALRQRSDVISLHCPLTEDNAGMIDRHFLRQLKPGTIVINTARGGLLNEADVATALAQGHLGGLGADVLSSEPPAADNPLLQAPRCVITPHSAWASREARGRLLDIAADNIAAFLRGEPVNTVA
jgi:glycerate dehydrogenase